MNRIFKLFLVGIIYCEHAKNCVGNVFVGVISESLALCNKILHYSPNIAAFTLNKNLKEMTDSNRIASSDTTARQR